MQIVMTNQKKKRLWTLIVPLIVLFLFVGLFVGSGIYRSLLRRELTEMKENPGTKAGYTTRLAEIEERNKQIGYIIGRDEATEQLIEELKTFNQ